VKNGDLVIKAMGAFGGGIASTGRVCGILIGGVSTVSTIFSRSSPEGKEDPRMWRLSYKLTKIFEDLTSELGGINCSNIARVNWKDKEEVQSFYNSSASRRQICFKLLEDFTEELGKVLEKEGF
jgi:hypothetical protein